MRIAKNVTAANRFDLRPAVGGRLTIFERPYGVVAVFGIATFTPFELHGRFVKIRVSVVFGNQGFRAVDFSRVAVQFVKIRALAAFGNQGFRKTEDGALADRIEPAGD